MSTTTDAKRMRVYIRWLIRKDRPAVLEIEHNSFDYPWIEEDFIQCLRQRNCIGMVAECDNRVVGFMIYELSKPCIHLLDFAVAPDVRHQRVGTQMVEKLKSKLTAERRNHITLEVDETNLAAQLFFAHHGFKATKVVRNHWDCTDRDAYFMQYHYQE